MSQHLCPYCKKGNLVTIQHLNTSITTECNACSRLVLLTKENGTWRLVLEVAALGASTVALLGFFGVRSWDDFVDGLDKIAHKISDFDV